jgi:hypothetical protein
LGHDTGTAFTGHIAEIKAENVNDFQRDLTLATISKSLPPFGDLGWMAIVHENAPRQVATLALYLSAN